MAALPPPRRAGSTPPPSQAPWGEMPAPVVEEPRINAAPVVEPREIVEDDYVKPAGVAATGYIEDQVDDEEYEEYVEPVKRKSASKPAPVDGSKRNRPPSKKGNIGPLAVRSRSVMRHRGNIVAGVLVAACAGVVVFGGWSALNPPPSAEETASIVAGQVQSDGTFASFDGVGSEFLRAYLTYPTGTAEIAENDEIINSLSGGEGSKWRTQSLDTPVGQKVIGTPTLDVKFLNSPTIAGALTGVYRAQVVSDGEAPRLVRYAVTLQASESGLAVVVAPPGFLNVATGVPEQDPATALPIDTAASQAASPSIIEFLKVWAQAGPDAEPSILTQLDAWLAKDASGFARGGLGGAFQYDALVEVALQPFAPGVTSTSGSVTVRWKDASGRTETQRYAVTVGASADGKFQVTDIGPA